MMRSWEITIVREFRRKGKGPMGGRCLYTRKEGTYVCEVDTPSTGMTKKGKGEMEM
jgi:hypothetical protein